MESKWLALGLIGAGCVLLFAAYKMDGSSSFEGGSFIAQILGIIVGCVFIAGGIGVILVDAFKAI